MINDVTASKIVLIDSHFGIEATKFNKKVGDFVEDFSVRVGKVEFYMDNIFNLEMLRLNSDEVVGRIVVYI